MRTRSLLQSLAWAGLPAALLLLLAAAASGCLRIKSDPVRVEPVEVKPIHITVDVNIKVDRELDKFFDDIDAAKPAAAPAPATPAKP